MRVLLIRESKGCRSLLVSSLKRQSAVVSAWRLISHSVIKKKKKAVRMGNSAHLLGEWSDQVLHCYTQTYLSQFFRSFSLPHLHFEHQRQTWLNLEIA